MAPLVSVAVVASTSPVRINAHSLSRATVQWRINEILHLGPSEADGRAAARWAGGRRTPARASLAFVQCSAGGILWVCLPACVGVEVEPSPPASLAHSMPPSLPPSADGRTDGRTEGVMQRTRVLSPQTSSSSSQRCKTKTYMATAQRRANDPTKDVDSEGGSEGV